MKKVILTMCVAGALLATSCKKAKDTKDATVEAATKAVDATTEAVTKAADVTTDAATKAVDATTEAVTKATDAVEGTVEKATGAVKSAIEGVSIPEFKDPKVAEHLNNYASYANDYIAAKGNVLKSAPLAKKAIELAAKGKTIVASLDAEGVKKYNTVMNAILSKMAPAK